jgi:hypothetical protein
MAMIERKRNGAFSRGLDFPRGIGTRPTPRWIVLDQYLP